jgi:hypothetical protein
MKPALRKYILRWELSGILFVFLVGALLHFLFEWSGESSLVAAFASINESVWEHFKQGFWPMGLFAAIEYLFPKMRVTNFLPAKAVAVWVIPVITGLVFYGYSAITGKEILIVDIIIFLIAIIIGQLISYRIMIASPLPRYSREAAGFFIVQLASILIITTYFPPHLPIFLDHNTGIYGIP